MMRDEDILAHAVFEPNPALAQRLAHTTKEIIRRELQNDRDALLELLARFAYQYRPEDPFVLASGARSDEYLDCKLALSQPEALPLVGRVILDRLDQRVVAVGGLTMGADPIAIATSCLSMAAERHVNWFSIRKEPKAHGQKRTVEGAVSAGDCVAIVEDVVTGGASTIKAIREARAADLQVVQVLTLVDRGAGGLLRIRGEVGNCVSAIFSLEEIRTASVNFRSNS